MAKRQPPLLVDPTLHGRAYCEAHSLVADQWLRDLWDTVDVDMSGHRVALVAMGGYGRNVLYPYSDLDLLLVHDGIESIGEIAEQLWYPVWDRGLKLGSTVVTLHEASELMSAEFDRATSFLTTRLLAGDGTLLEEFDALTAKFWNRESARLLEELAAVVRERRIKFGDVAYKLEPNLKEGHGGLRDLHAMGWAERAYPGFASDFLEELHPVAEVLVDARVELHRLAGRPGDVLYLDDQDAVAKSLAKAGGNELMLAISSAARRIAWYSEEAWHRLGRRQARQQRPRPPTILTDEVAQIDGQIAIRSGIDVDSDPLLLLRVAEISAVTGNPIARRTLEMLAASEARMPEPWPSEARDMFANIFASGPNAIQTIEDLDQFNLFTRLLPEWQHVMSLPQRNVLHTYTVDRHLCEAAANASRFQDKVSRPDLLLVGTLLHDIGKGHPGDHTEVGMRLISNIARRMGYPPDDIAVLVDLCRLHLLLPDVATRRELTDPGTIRAVAAAVDSVDFLELLAALTEADSIATGPATWGSWKAGLLRELVERTASMLNGEEKLDVEVEFPSEGILAVVNERRRSVAASGSTFTVVDRDVPGLFAKGAGILAMNGLDVLEAGAYSSDNGFAVNQFEVQSSTGAPVEWGKIIADTHRALDARLALSARISRRARDHARYRRKLAASPPPRRVNIDNSISDHATVVDVHAPDSIGLLYRMTLAIAELRLDVRSARVQTLGPEAVDSFYLANANGEKITDPTLLEELTLALTEAIGPEENA